MADTESSSISIRDYIEAAKESSTRTRYALLVIIFASVLTLMSFLNSLPNSQIRHRLTSLQKVDKNDYLKDEIGPLPDESSKDFKFYKIRYSEYVSAVTHAYIDTSNLVHVPVLGLTIDINDLGILSGVALVISQFWLWFCISRERDNLGVLFTEAKKRQNLLGAYTLLAMRRC